MGWKNVKEHYGITHYVQVSDKGICIGSGYVHDLIVISPADMPRNWYGRADRTETKIGHNISIWRPTYLGRGEPFDGIVNAMADDPAKLRELIDTPDTFAASITVYTYDYDGNIIEKQCEELGWPNVTHDGTMMYENRVFATHKEAVRKARQEMAAWVKSAKEHVAGAERDLQERRDQLAKAEAAADNLRASGR